MAVSLDPRLELIQILKTTQQSLCTLKMKEDQKKVHKAPKLFQETVVCILIIAQGPITPPPPLSLSLSLSACFDTQLLANLSKFE